MSHAFHIIASAMLMSVTFKSAGGIPVPSFESFIKYPLAVNYQIQETGEEKAKILLFRLQDIKAMDKSGLTAYKKKELRREVRSIKHQFREIYSGSYISIGSFLMTEVLLIF